jgi:hypothetical protein
MHFSLSITRVLGGYILQVLSRSVTGHAIRGGPAAEASSVALRLLDVDENSDGYSCAELELMIDRNTTEWNDGKHRRR